MLDYKNVLRFVNQSEIEKYEQITINAKNKLLDKNGEGNDFLGWVDYPLKINNIEINQILDAAEKIRNTSEVLLVIGIGGSYLGAKSALSMLKPYFRKANELEVIFVGNTLSSTYTKELMDYLSNKDFSINVISKSGTTTEPAIAFRIFKNLLESKYGDNYNQRVYCTTTLNKGALYSLAVINKYQIFSIPEDIGGRYSVLTPVGLLPIAASNIDIIKMIDGAKAAYQDCLNKNYLENEALLYAAIRHLLYQRGKLIEILVTYEPKLSFLSEWYKQLFGESEGKDHQGIYPSSVTYTTDLHSLGQYVQDGKRHIFETVLNIVMPETDLVIKRENDDFDQLNYLASKTLDEVNKQAFKGTLLAHVDGEVPNIIINLPEISAYYYGYLVYFMMFSCGVSGYLLGVNPFNQEGVEAYKKNMFALLGKSGYESLREELLKKL